MRASSLFAAVAALASASSVAAPARAAVKHRTAKFRRHKPSAIRNYYGGGAVDAGLFPRATERRASRDRRRAQFQAAKALHGSARQARLRGLRP